MAMWLYGMHMGKVCMGACMYLGAGAHTMGKLNVVVMGLEETGI